MLDSLRGALDGPVPLGFQGTYRDFLARLQPASFRGVPFGVTLGESRFGRRIALHEYPFRDTPWPEDVGRGTRKFSIQGFLITDSLIYGGGDVIDQREQLVAAVETLGSGTMIHPTLGRLQVSVPEDGLIVTERLDGATFMEFSLACYEAGERKFPSAAADLGDDVDFAADALDQAASGDFIDDVLDAFDYGAFAVQMAADTVDGWVSLLGGAARDATGIFNLVASLPGDFGRFFHGALVGYARGLLGPTVPLTLENLVFSATQARADVADKGVALVAAAHQSDPALIPPAAQAAAAALQAAIVNPADGVRLYARLANFYPAEPTGASVIGQARATIQTATGNLMRRTALAALVRVVDTYQPQSEEDANQVRVQVCDLLEAEAVIAGDSGDDRAFAALLQARGTVASAMDLRGAQLPPMQQFTLPESMSSLVVGQRLYQDSGRADELVREADARHPAFMPLTFKALSS